MLNIISFFNRKLIKLVCSQIQESLCRKISAHPCNQNTNPNTDNNTAPIGFYHSGFQDR
jgi:hypothetical protein